MAITTQDIRQAARHLNLAGHCVCVHASLRSFGWVKGGAEAVVDGLLEEGCTLLVPTFTDYALCTDEKTAGSTSDTGRIYTPDTNEIAADMGRIPAAVVEMAGRARGHHPLSSFSAVGPLKHSLVNEQTPLKVYAPLVALAENNGFIVLMGVGMDKLTLLHLAEQHAGRHLPRRWVNGSDGQPMQVEVGGCSDGFIGLDALLSPLAAQTNVGQSLWRAYPARAVLDRAIQAIRDDPSITWCTNPECKKCQNAVLNAPSIR